MSTPDISHLSPSQQEALQTYTSVTDQDPIAAISLLQRSEWNVQIAISRFFDGEPAHDPLAEARAGRPAASSQVSNLQDELLRAAARPPIVTRSPGDRVERIDTSASTETHHRPPFLLSALLTPLNIMYRVFSAILSPFSFLVPSFLSRLLGRLLQQRTRPARRVLPPADNAQRFIREFSEEYGESEIPFAESGFNLTLDNAKRDLQFLLVVLLSPNHDDNHTWVRETLLSSQVKAFLHSHRDELVLWGGNVQDAEAYQVASGLQCTKFPFAALICYTTESGPPGMTVVMRAVGPMSASELVAKLGTAMTAHQAPLRVAQAQRAEHQAARNLRQEQDSAYERSLAQDRERARRRREEQEAQARAEKEAQERAEAQELRKTNLEQWKRWRAQSLPSEPGPDVSDTIRVSIRLPSGERVIRKFRTDADLEEVYAFVECYEILRSNEDLSTSEVNEPANFEHAYGFQLVSPMPRTVYDVEKGGSIGDRVGRGANLIVEPVEEEGDETEDDGIR